jgi:hypothetical protein
MKIELIEDLVISVRLSNVLKYMNITTIKEALSIPKWKYYESRNMGKRSMMELEIQLSKFPEFAASIFNCSFSTPKLHMNNIEKLLEEMIISSAERRSASLKMEAIEKALIFQMSEIIKEHSLYVESRGN